MNNIEVDKEELMTLWNNSFSIVQKFEPFLQKPMEYYYHSGVMDCCRFLIGEKKMLSKDNNITNE